MERPPIEAAGHAAEVAAERAHAVYISRLAGRHTPPAAPAATLLARLDGVRSAGDGRSQALCPAHEDRTPSLSVRELPDGTILLHCWAGCSAAEVVHAVGLELRDLFPRCESLSAGRPPERRPWRVEDVLHIAAREATVLAIGVERIWSGDPLELEDRQRMAEAGGRLRDIAEALKGGGL